MRQPLRLVGKMEGRLPDSTRAVIITHNCSHTFREVLGFCGSQYGEESTGDEELTRNKPHGTQDLLVRREQISFITPRFTATDELEALESPT